MIKFYLKKHYTVHVEVEAILNSRLLTAVSDDVNNYVALTPNHFLIGQHQIIAYRVTLKKVK